MPLSFLQHTSYVMRFSFVFRGFLKSDKLLGTVNVKLVPLESQCTQHDSYDVSILGFSMFYTGS